MNYEVCNPYDQRVLGRFSYTGPEAVEAALQRTGAGRERQRTLPAHERAAILRRLASLLEANAEALAALVTAETGKTISDARVELSRAVNTTIASSEAARQQVGEVLDSDAYPPTRGRIGVACWRPVGTVLCITPFNFPINIAMHKLGPAFAAGNAVLFKPAPVNTASARRLTELCYEAGFPEETLQCLLPPLEAMPALVADPRVHAVNFTGGEAAAAAIAAAAGYKKLLLELGGNDALVLMADGDIDGAVAAAINQRFATAGQRCTAAKRVFVQAPVYAAFRDALLAAAGSLRAGDPTDPETFVGPVISAAAADLVEHRLEDAVRRGGRVLLGGGRKGNVIEATVIEDVPDDCDLVREETFGPVLPLRRFDSFDELTTLVNDSPYGLQAGVFTRDLELARRCFDDFEVGTVAINDGPGFRAEHFPFGGVKASGIGREGMSYAMREMSYLKTLVL